MLKNVRRLLKKYVSRFDEEQFWHMYDNLYNKKRARLLRMVDLYRLRRIESLHNAQMGTDIDGEKVFETHPILPHGISNIVISSAAKIGKNCMIYHNVTIGRNYDGAPEIGDNCFFGVGAICLGGKSWR